MAKPKATQAQPSGGYWYARAFLTQRRNELKEEIADLKEQERELAATALAIGKKITECNVEFSRIDWEDARIKDLTKDLDRKTSQRPAVARREQAEDESLPPRAGWWRA